MKIILASGSPRRREILENLGLEFEVVVSSADENTDTKDVYALVQELSFKKASAVQAALLKEGRDLEDTLIIGCDSVVYKDSAVLGKPKDRENALQMLTTLSGSGHSVISGLTLLYGEKALTAFEETEVFFDAVGKEELADYIATGESDDKAGAYAIQGRAAKWIKGIKGCYYNVVGLPVHRLCSMAKALNLSL